MLNDNEFDDNVLVEILYNENTYLQYYICLVNKQFNRVYKNSVLCIYIKDLSIYIKDLPIMDYIRTTYPTSVCYMRFNEDTINSIDLYTLKDLYMLYISCCNIITDVSMLGKLHTLDMSGCNKITDISMLGNLHTLNISYCNSIIDISMLGNVYILYASACNYITNVPIPKRLHTLDISYCNRIIDISVLGNSHLRSLNIIECDGITDISMIINLDILHVGYYHKENVSKSIRNVSILKLGFGDIGFNGYSDDDIEYTYCNYSDNDSN